LNTGTINKCGSIRRLYRCRQRSSRETDTEIIKPSSRDERYSNCYIYNSGLSRFDAITKSRTRQRDAGCYLRAWRLPRTSGSFICTALPSSNLPSGKICGKPRCAAVCAAIRAASSESDTVRLAQFNSHSFRFSPVTFASASAPVSVAASCICGFRTRMMRGYLPFPRRILREKMKIPIARPTTDALIETFIRIVKNLVDS